MGTERRLPVSDAEVLEAYQAGESQPALAQRFKVSKGAVQKAIARAKGGSSEPSPQPSAPPGPACAGADRPQGRLDIRERLEHEALNAGASRTRLSALKMLQQLDATPDAGARTQSKTARSERQFWEESGFFFNVGALVIEGYDKDHFRAFERTERA